MKNIISRTLILTTTLFLYSFAGTTGPGGSCSADHNHLDSFTHKFVSDCSDQTYCSEPQNGTCVARTCRRDEFPFGYSPIDVLPPLCPQGSFCPDEGDGCRLQVDVGGACQLNRDEQCAPATDWRVLMSSENYFGSICLRSVCMYANATLGSQCVIDNTTYIEVGPDGQQITTIIARDNCRSPQFYCGQTSTLCEATKPLGSFCQANQECKQRNCAQGVCVEAPETPLRVAPWQYAITALCIIGAMIATCILLTLIHKRHRLQHYKELREYYFEQLSLRRSIIALHSAAATADHEFESKLK